jgi:chromosome segregation ATPase
VEVAHARRLLHVKAGEVTALRRKVRAAEQARDALADELVALTETKREQDKRLAEQAESLPKLRAFCAELKRKHRVLLELLGAKEEEIDGLRAEAQEQGREVEGLLGQIEVLRAALEAKARAR